MDIEELLGEVTRRRELRFASGTLLESAADADADLEAVIIAATALAASVTLRQHAGTLSDATAVEILLRDIRLRELAVRDREERVWGWRLLVAGHDDALRAEIAAVETRERDLRQAELTLRAREVDLAARERAVEQKALLIRETFNAQSQSMRATLARMEKKVPST
jgi:hypothetical protein